MIEASSHVTAHGDILIVEDDSDIRDLIQFNLERDGFKTRVAKNGEEALWLAFEQAPSLILMDIMMPVCDGLTALRKLRGSTGSLRHVPVVMLTAKGEESDIVHGLELGADDYMMKPFSPRELTARIRAVLRRAKEGDPRSVSEDGPLSSEKRDSESMRVGPIEIDLERHEARSRGKALVLTLAEFNLLKTLISKPGRVFTRDQLLENISGAGTYVIDRNVDVHVRAVRKKLEDDAEFIQTVRGVGYKCREV